MHILKKQTDALFVALRGAYPELQRAEIADNLVVRQGTSFGDLKNDTELGIDKRLGRYFQDRLQRSGIARLSIEGMQDLTLSKKDGPWATVDPLDGSLNFKRRNGSQGLPFTSCVTLLSTSGPEAKFKDIVSAGVIDLRNGDIWFSEINEAGAQLTMLNDKYARTDSEPLDLTKQIVIGEFYYPENRERLCAAFAGQKGWLRNPGSAAYEMALVASGTSAAFICDRQKQHELGAGIALVLGAGGVVCDLSGNGLMDTPYTFNAQTPVLLAGNAKIAERILCLLN